MNVSSPNGDKRPPLVALLQRELPGSTKRKRILRAPQKSSSISNYDCVILFSGGKDSTYLAHLIKKAKAERICLFFIDNSFEDGKYVKEIAAKLNIDLYVYKPKEEEIIAKLKGVRRK